MGVHYQSHFVLCEFLLVGLENAVRIHDKMQVVYREMTCHGAKSNEVKWNWSTILAHEKLPNVHVVL